MALVSISTFGSVPLCANTGLWLLSGDMPGAGGGGVSVGPDPPPIDARNCESSMSLRASSSAKEIHVKFVYSCPKPQFYAVKPKF